MKKMNIKGAAMQIVATGGAAVACAAASSKVEALHKLDPAIRGAAFVAAGAFGPQLLGKGKSAEMMKNAGAGAIAFGSLLLANATIFKNDKDFGISGVDTLGGVPGVYVDPMDYPIMPQPQAPETTTLGGL